MPTDCLLPRFICCLGRLLNVQHGRDSVFVMKGFEVGGGGYVSRSFVSISRLACFERGLHHAVFRETWEEPLKRSLSNLVVDLGGSLLAEESKVCLRVLTQLDTFVRGPIDVCLGQELVLDELSGSSSDSECGAPSGHCGDLCHALHATISPLRRCCTKVVHDVDDFPFSVGFVLLQPSHRCRRIPASKTAPGSHAPQVRQASIFCCNTCRGSSAPVNFPRPPNWKLAVSCNLSACSACKRCIVLRCHQHQSTERRDR